MTRQRAAFLKSEGDAWFDRNHEAAGHKATDIVVDGLAHLQFRPGNVAEVGCGEGKRLELIRKRFSAECIGFDPSAKAIKHAKLTYPWARFSVGTAERLDVADGSLDLLIFGFCLYLTDPSDHFRIAAEADRVLKDGGVIAVLDFCPKNTYRNEYSHMTGVFSHKTEFSRMFTWSPAYRLVHRVYTEHQPEFLFQEDEAVTADFIMKDTASAFPLAPRY